MSHNETKPWASYAYCKNRRKGSVADSFAQYDESLKTLHESISVSNSECNGRCQRTYKECLKSQGINLQENSKELKKQANRALDGLFSKNSPDRIYVQRSEYNRQNLFGRE